MSGSHSAGKGDRVRPMNRARYAENYDAVNWNHPEYRLIRDVHTLDWFVIRADEVPVFERWCDAMAGRGEHVPGDFQPTPVDGPESVRFREWRVNS